MKTLFSMMVVLIVSGIGGFFPSAAQLPLSSAVPEERTDASPPPEPILRGLSADHGLGKGVRPQRARPHASIQFESGRPRRTVPEKRRDEALQLHENTLDRFQNADSSGRLLLSFSSGGGVDLTLRNITGAEAPVATVKPRDK